MVSIWQKRDQVDTQLSELGLASTIASKNQTLDTVGSCSENWIIKSYKSDYIDCFVFYLWYLTHIICLNTGHHKKSPCNPMPGNKKSSED